MFITIAATVACVCVAVLPAVAEVKRVLDEKARSTAQQSGRRHVA